MTNRTGLVLPKSLRMHRGTRVGDNAVHIACRISAGRSWEGHEDTVRENWTGSGVGALLSCGLGRCNPIHHLTHTHFIPRHSPLLQSSLTHSLNALTHLLYHPATRCANSTIYRTGVGSIEKGRSPEAWRRRWMETTV